MLVFHLSGSFSANSSQFASFAAARTSSSVAPLRPRRMFSRIVFQDVTLFDNTILENRLMSFSGSIRETSMPPTVMLPFW